jgi:hypothetical protein
MGAVLPYVKNPLVFGPEAIRGMSVAFDEACRILNVSDAANDAREAIATRIIEWARRGEKSGAFALVTIVVFGEPRT